MNKYRINTTGIIDGISNLNINIAEDNNHTSNSSIARVSYSTKQTFIDIHVENGQIVDTGSCSITGPYQLYLNNNNTIITNDNDNKIYDQVICGPYNSGTPSILVQTGLETTGFFSSRSHSIFLTYKLMGWYTYSVSCQFFNAGRISYRSSQNQWANVSTGLGTLISLIGMYDHFNQAELNSIGGEKIYVNDFYEKIGQWCKLIITVDELNLETKIYLDNILLATDDIPEKNKDHILSPRAIHLLGGNSTPEIHIESLKVISGVWTPENQIDLED